MAFRGLLICAVMATYSVISVAPANATLVALRGVRTVCGTITGPKWHTPLGNWSGNKYVVTVTGHVVAPSCGEAKAWVTKLIKDRAPNHNPHLLDPNVLTNGPSDYTCKAGADTESRAYEGNCYKGNPFNPTSEADWAPVLPF